MNHFTSGEHGMFISPLFFQKAQMNLIILHAMPGAKSLFRFGGGRDLQEGRALPCGLVRGSGANFEILNISKLIYS